MKVYRLYFAQRLLKLGVLFLLGLGLWLVPQMFLAGWTTPANPDLPSIESRTEQSFSGQSADELYQQGRYPEAIDQWLQLLNKSTDLQDIAAIHANLGTTYRQIGQFEQAIQQWKQAIRVYQSLEAARSQQVVAQLLTDQGQAYTALGQYRLAIPLLETAIDQARQQQDIQIETAAVGALGNAYLASGKLNRAITTQETALKLALQANQFAYQPIILNHLGNAFYARSQRYLRRANTAKQEGNKAEQTTLFALAQQDLSAAQDAYRRSLAIHSQPSFSQITALLNLVHLLQQSPNSEMAAIAGYRSQASALIPQFPNSRAKVYALINLAASLDPKTPEKRQILEQAIVIARQLGDARSLSFGLGTLGKLYESQGNFEQAFELTRQAQFAAQQVHAGDSLYRWQWQLGRLYQALGKTESALLSYQQAVTTLQSIRSDIAAASKDLQFDVRDSVEPVYRELIYLLLANQKTLITSTNTQSSIQKALQVAELLKLTELQNFFGDECLEVAQNSTRSNTIPIANTAVIHSLVLDRQTYIVLRKPDGTFSNYSIDLTKEQLQQKISRLRFTLENIATNEYLDEVKDVYNLLIRPLEADLARIKPETLVFVQDGILRNVPMAALHDGKQFLIEKYPIATTLGLNLTPNRQRPTEFNASIFGLTVEVPPFPALPNVSIEVQEVQRIVGGSKFLDKDFT
ncbi:MAG: tetratricopeptide repeat protein, partial [Leptolyngbyaceae cyanobacterium bins.59]|nr:tetratricopeptide repeat protein [Leptolyngbyaceae cyanobacterium bins.59]